MSSRLSKDTLKSIAKTITLKQQTQNAKKSLHSLPAFSSYVKDVLVAAPYLLFLFFIIAGIDIQNRFFGHLDPAALNLLGILSISLITIANAITYTETYNTHTNEQRISAPGWYGVRRSLRLFAVMALSFSIAIAGLLLFIVPGLYFALRLSLAPPACLIDDLGIRESMIKSIEATKGQTTLIYTVFTIIGLPLLPLLILAVVTSGWLEILIIFILFGGLPALIQISFGVLYMNSKENSKVKLLNEQ